MAEMTEQELKGIEERWAKSTPGPWGVRGDNIVAPHMDGECIVATYLPWDPTYTREEDKQTITSIASAPTDIANLLTEVKRLQSENECLRKGVDLNG